MPDSINARPTPVRAAIILFCLVILLGTAKLARTLTMAAGPGGHSFTVFAFIATYSVMALLVIYLGMGASWARGALFALFLIAIAPGLALAFAHYQAIPWLAALTFGQVAAMVCGLFLVYREPAAGWFRRPGTAVMRHASRR